jgi:hypothetical protein
MKRQFILFLSFVVLSATTFTVSAQINTPAPSPSCEMTQDIGLTKVTINYSRPGMKGRTIFADDGLVPFGKMWRLGANSATKITFSDKVKIGGKDVEAGSYAVLAMPNAKEWKFNFYPYESGSWGSYVQKEPAASVMAKSYSTGEVSVESFTIAIGNLTNTTAMLEFLWEKTYVAIPMEVYVDERVEKEIKRVLAGPSAGDYYAAASYYHESGKDLNQALEWVQKATHVDKPMFWQVRREALILADLKRYPEAIKAATKSMELAKAAGNDDYVAMNKKSIANWSKK